MSREYTRPRRAMRLALSALLVIEVFFLIKLFGEGGTGNITLIVSSVGIVVLCALTWRGSSWGRWVIVALLVWRLVEIGFDVSNHLAPGDKRMVGTLMLVGVYLAVGLVIASPLGGPVKRPPDS